MRNLLIAIGLSLSAAPVATAQPRPDSIEVTAAALSHRAAIDSTRTRIGVRAREYPGNVANARAAVAASANAKLRMIELTESIPMVCQTRYQPWWVSSKEICKFRDYDAVVEAAPREIKENTATVRVWVESNSTHPIERTGINRRIEDYDLQRKNGKWVVVRVILVGVS